MLNFNSSKINLYIIALAALVAIAQASIENKPVKVTHHNSGPSYDIDEVERTKLTPEREDGQVVRHFSFTPIQHHAQPSTPSTSKLDNNNKEEEKQQPGDNDGPLVGHINIRRIFLIPMSQPNQDDDTSSSNIWSPSALSPRQSQPIGQPPRDEGDDQSAPVWPFLSHATRHLFGTDQASRSPPNRPEESLSSRPSTLFSDKSSSIDNERERENSPEARQRPPFDPIQMMIEMMQQALSQAIMTPNGPFQDLNKEAAGEQTKPTDSDNKAESSEANNNNPADNTDANEVPKRPIIVLHHQQPFKQPVSNNSTKEEVVEIDGKKYLKKTVVNRHVGENIIFMTKRLLFVPMNETTPPIDSIENKGENTSPASIPSEEVRKAEADPTTTTTATTSTTTQTEAASTTTSTTEPTTTTTTTTTVSSTTPEPEPSSTTDGPKAAPTTLSTTISSEASLKDKVAEAIEKASERLVKSISSSDQA